MANSNNITLRNVVSRPLTYEELDTNFQELIFTINDTNSHINSTQAHEASNITFDPSGSDLTSTNVQSAIDEHVESSTAHAADDITFDPSTSELGSTTVQSAIVEHVESSTAHAADDITYDNSNSSLSGTTVKQALDELGIKNNPSATVDPTVTDDETQGYKPFSQWINTITSESFICLDATTGAAVWEMVLLPFDNLGSAAFADTGDFDAAGSAQSAQDFAIQRANHTGTQPLSTISDAGTAAAANTGDFDAAGSAQSAQDFAIQRANHTGTQPLSTISDAGTAAAANTGTGVSDVPTTSQADGRYLQKEAYGQTVGDLKVKGNPASGEGGEVTLLGVGTGDDLITDNLNGEYRVRSENSVNLLVNDTTVIANGSKVWTAGNDGEGSGMDADLLDGLDSHQFLRSDTDDSFTGKTLSMLGDGVGFRFYSGNDAAGIRWNNPGGNSGELEFWTTDDYEEPFVFRGYDVGSVGEGANQEWFRVDSSNAKVRGQVVWHAGNDGAGSGLDADLLDGWHRDQIRDWNNITNKPAGLGNTGAGQVGTYAMLRDTNGVRSDLGRTEAGSNLRFCNANDDDTSSQVPSGTWRCMGFNPGVGSDIGRRATVWLRIS